MISIKKTKQKNKQTKKRDSQFIQNCAALVMTMVKSWKLSGCIKAWCVKYDTKQKICNIYIYTHTLHMCFVLYHIWHKGE